MSVYPQLLFRLCKVRRLPIWMGSLADILALRVQDEEAIDSWAGLLQIYGGLYLPVIFALLFELNLDAFVSARINYEVRLWAIVGRARS